MKYLIDTDWTIQTLTGNTQAVTVLEKLKPIDVAMSLVSIGEIYEGAFSYADPQAHLKIFRQFLSSFTLLDNINCGTLSSSQTLTLHHAITEQEMEIVLVPAFICSAHSFL